MRSPYRYRGWRLRSEAAVARGPATSPEEGAPGLVVPNIALVKNLRHVVDVTVVDELHSDHLPALDIGNEPNEPTPHTVTPWTGRNLPSTSKITVVTLTRIFRAPRKSRKQLWAVSEPRLTQSPFDALRGLSNDPPYPSVS